MQNMGKKVKKPFWQKFRGKIDILNF